MLKLLMVGAGGIGSYYAARLLESGHRVVLTARGAHLDALVSNGLKVHYGGEGTDSSSRGLQPPAIGRPIPS